MSSVSIREAKNRLTELARRVEAGERVVVTRHGRPVFEMVPPRSRSGGLDWEAGEAYLRARGVVPAAGWVAPDFDAPLPEDFLVAPSERA